MLKITTRSLLFVFFCFIMAITVFSHPAFSKWKLKITVENADIRQSPDRDSPVVKTAVWGDILESFEKEGEWFRVVVGPDEAGFVSIGYLHSGDVAIEEEKVSRQVDFWPEEPEHFEEKGINIKVAAGYNSISQGDIENGIQGLFDSTTDLFLSRGYQAESYPEHLRSIIDLTADVIYSLSPKFGIGLGFGYLYGQRGGVSSFYDEGISDIQNAHSDTTVSAVFPRAGIVMTIPLNPLFSLSLNGGSALYFAKYSHFLSTPFEMDNLSQSASSKSVGFHGGIGLEIRLVKRAALLIEALGRYAKIGGFEGKAAVAREVNNLWVKSTEEGKLYFVETDTHPRLIISRQRPSGYREVREACLDLSGFSLQIGFLVRF